MRTRTYRTALLSTLLLAGCTPRETMPELTDRVFAVAAAQYEQLEGRLTDETLPRSVASDGKFIPSNIRWWCSGFYPGSLWYIYEYTGDKTFRELAEKNTFKLYPLKQKGTDHDLGFQMNCSFGNAYRITGEQKYLEPIHTSARVLAGRFSPVTGVIRSWDFVRKGRDWKYPVIIDNMMNLEHLYNAGLLFGDDTLKSVAVTHANTTLCNHFRPDFTSYHLVDYDPADGRVRRKETVQGFSDESAWARGQAWALYGYTMMFRLSGYKCYLNQAENIAGMLLERLPDDGTEFKWSQVTGLENWDQLTPRQRAVFFCRDGLKSNAKLASQKTQAIGICGQDIFDRYYLDNGNEARIKAAYDKRDPRLKQTIVTPYEPVDCFTAGLNGDENMIGKQLRWPLYLQGTSGGDFWLDKRTSAYYCYRKYVRFLKGELIDRQRCYTDFPLIRYTDVILQWAEALIELNEFTPAKNLIDQVRARAHMPGITIGGLDAMREAVRYERRVEFPVEAVNFFDEVRWGTYKETKSPGLRRGGVHTPEPADNPEGRQPETKPFHIMVVEDTPDLREFLVKNFEDTYGVLSAKNGAEALAILEQQACDLIISDALMPEMDGFDLLMKVRNDEMLCHIPFILLSGVDSVASKIKGLEYGADVYIEKPFSLGYVKATVESLLENRKRAFHHFASRPGFQYEKDDMGRNDRQWLDKLTGIVRENLTCETLSVDLLTEKMALSRSSLQRKLKGLTGVSPNEYIQLVRLKTAAQLLRSGEYRISEVCYLTGFSSMSWFAKCFTKQFGMRPKDFIRQNQDGKSSG